MRVICLDLEGVLVPEIWESLAVKTKINELKLTTRDIKNYDELMSHRLKIINDRKLKISDILGAVEPLVPFKGALEFLNKLSKDYQVLILSDTFYEISYPLIAKLNFPNVFCHHLSIGQQGDILGYKLRLNNQKKATVKAFQSLNFEVFAVGDSYNDLDMLRTANLGVLYMAPQLLLKEYPDFLTASNYEDLYSILSGDL